ncbi:MAG: response regulator transcription factor [Ignavibacteriales bacterium]|nr:response regulator transcription factor [Ignavibacteriales bacterium]
MKTKKLMSQNDIIRIALIEDKKEIREGLNILISGSTGFNCAASFADAESAIRKIPSLDIDVILMDINLPNMSGIDCVKVLKPLLRNTQIIMLTMYDDNEHVFEALKAGAAGYLLKRTPPAKILEAVKEVHTGGSPMSMQIARMVVKSFSEKPAGAKLDEKLTEREFEILGQLSKGLRYQEIADKLFISVETVRTHLRKIYEKLQVRNSTEAVLKYLQK